MWTCLLISPALYWLGPSWSTWWRSHKPAPRPWCSGCHWTSSWSGLLWRCWGSRLVPPHQGSSAGRRPWPCCVAPCSTWPQPWPEPPGSLLQSAAFLKKRTREELTSIKDHSTKGMKTLAKLSVLYILEALERGPCLRHSRDRQQNKSIELSAAGCDAVPRIRMARRSSSLVPLSHISTYLTKQVQMSMFLTRQETFCKWRALFYTAKAEYESGTCVMVNKSKFELPVWVVS